MTTKGTITVVGAGLMGTAIATLGAAHGYKVMLHDKSEGLLESFPSRAAPIAQYLAGPSRTAEEILALVECSASLEHSVQGSSLVQEAIHEDLDAKRALFEQLDEMCAPDVMLSTNTSSFLLSEICGHLSGRERIIGIHYVAPAHLIRAIEIITASFTSQALIERAKDFINSIDHVGIVCRERPGFIINRLQYALKAEAQRMMESGVAAEDIDAAFRLAIGPRIALWGPMMQEDLSASKKTVLAVTDYLHKTTGEAHFKRTALLEKLVDRGHLGAMAGAGWYQWDIEPGKLVAERDRQLGELLDWLRTHDSIGALGVKGENEQVHDNSQGT